MAEQQGSDAYATEGLYADYLDQLRHRYLTFWVGGQEYGVQIRYVVEIVGMQPLTDLEGVPDHVKGAIDLRNGRAPVMDMRLRFGMEPRDYDDSTCVVVVEVGGTVLGLAVDLAGAVIEIPPDLVSPPVVAAGAGEGVCIQGVRKLGEDVTRLLDVERLVGDENSLH